MRTIDKWMSLNTPKTRLGFPPDIAPGAARSIGAAPIAPKDAAPPINHLLDMSILFTKLSISLSFPIQMQPKPLDLDKHSVYKAEKSTRV